VIVAVGEQIFVQKVGILFLGFRSVIHTLNYFLNYFFKGKLEMDKRFAILLAIATIISIYEVLSNGSTQPNKGADKSVEQDDDDDTIIKSIDDLVEEGESESPAYKYSEEAQQQEEEVQIREPSRHGTPKMPINMPPVRFEFW
jgi:hypothetical protein